MSGREHLQALMREIGPRLGLLEVDEFGDGDRWTLVVDEDTVLFADHDAAGRRLVLSADVGRPADEGRAGLHALLLRYNNRWPETGGVRMALDDADGDVVQLFDLPVADLDLERLRAAVAGFADTLKAWREIVARAGVPTPAGEAPFGMSMAGMIRG